MATERAARAAVAANDAGLPIGLAASLIPSIKASAVPPADALRSD